jgi:isoleucyl-tRNA synthetase
VSRFRDRDDIVDVDNFETNNNNAVDNEGKFTKEAGEFAGMNVLTDGSKAVVDALKQRGLLLKVERYKHSYPYDWRTKEPVIIRYSTHSRHYVINDHHGYQ